jgi:hypothetical protein
MTEQKINHEEYEEKKDLRALRVLCGSKYPVSDVSLICATGSNASQKRLRLVSGNNHGGG